MINQSDFINVKSGSIQKKKKNVHEGIEKRIKNLTFFLKL